MNYKNLLHSFQAERILILRLLGEKGFNFISDSPLFYTKAKKARLKSKSRIILTEVGKETPTDFVNRKNMKIISCIKRY